MLAGLVLLEALSIGLFTALLIRQQAHEVHEHMLHRLEHQATSMALQAAEALEQQRPGWVGLSVNMMGEAPSVAFAKVTDPAGNLLFVSRGEPEELTLDPAELAQIPLAVKGDARVFASAATAGRESSPLSPAATCAALPGWNRIAAGTSSR
jgi:hypothetical protein